MDITQMKYFMQLFEDRSFTKAASRMFISQQGLSRIIKSMEDECQVSFFQRTKRRIEPTFEGNVMYESCKRIVIEHDELMEKLSSMKKQENIIRIGATSVLYSEQFSQSILKFHENNPDIQLEFIALGYYDCERYLENNIVDFCITIKPDSLMKYKFKRIWTDQFYLFTDYSNPLASKPKVRMKELKNEKIILLSRDTKGGAMIRECLMNKGFYANVILSTSQMPLAFKYVIRKMAVAILPRYGVPQEYSGSRL